MYKLVVYVPESQLEQVKSALFTAGAGKVGDYDQCSWQTSGTGQFRPLAGSNPFIGELDQLEQVTEYRLETVVENHHIESVIKALYQAHPYEEPAYDCWQVEDFSRLKPVK
ncbi:MAG: YqfO family protein [Immundisolibacteraceae bacterium]|nr:YqfO family protein [Immundisolibacteraceae bacterium]